MAATRALTITDVYERFVKGKKTKVEDWDYKVIPENLTALKEKYNIKIDENTIIPEDKELINNLFQAGLEMLVTTGYYCQDLGRVMKVTEEEVWEGIKKTPTKLILGEGRDIARFYPRHGNSSTKPIIQPRQWSYDHHRGQACQIQDPLRDPRNHGGAQGNQGSKDQSWKARTRCLGT